MSEQIDWSKAPEWAKKYGLSGAFKSPVWFDDEKYTYVDGQQDGKEFFYADVCTYAAKDFSQVSERPSTPSWSGEGLPPVGVKVLIMNPEQFAITDYGQEFVGEECTVRAAFVNDLDYRMVAVEKVGGACCCFLSEMCFPIRTPEQIAADEREAAIKEMTANYAKNSDTLAGWAAYVYDTLGYRKP